MIEPKTLNMLIDRYNEKLDSAKRKAVADVTFVEPSTVENIQIIVEANQLWGEMKPQIESDEFFQLMIDGRPGSGKTTIAREIAHLAHTDDYFSLYESGFDVLDAPASLVQKARESGKNKFCIVLDDISYTLSASSGTMQSKFKSFFTMLRHALKKNPGDVIHILVIVIAHFTTAVPPILKNSGIWIFTKPSTQEYDQMIKIVGRSKKLRGQLEHMFNAIVAIQSEVKPNESFEFNMYGQPFQFTWNVDGRLSLILKNGEPMIYHSRNLSCQQCAYIGGNVRVNPANYLPTAKEEKQA